MAGLPVAALRTVLLHALSVPFDLAGGMCGVHGIGGCAEVTGPALKAQHEPRGLSAAGAAGVQRCLSQGRQIFRAEDLGANRVRRASAHGGVLTAS